MANVIVADRRRLLTLIKKYPPHLKNEEGQKQQSQKKISQTQTINYEAGNSHITAPRIRFSTQKDV